MRVYDEHPGAGRDIQYRATNSLWRDKTPFHVIFNTRELLVYRKDLQASTLVGLTLGEPSTRPPSCITPQQLTTANGLRHASGPVLTTFHPLHIYIYLI